jgi:hypothetical protein
MAAKLALVCVLALVHISSQASINSDASTNADVSTDPNDVEFHLYSNPANPTESEVLIFNDIESVKKSKYNPALRTIFYTSGFLQNRHTDQAIKDAYLRAGFTTSANVILVDWGKLSGSVNPPTSDLGAALLYPTVKANVDVVGDRIADFITFLSNNGQLLAGPDNVHLVGQSLGAHIMGMAGKLFRDANGKPIGRITGTDAAAQLFQGVSKDKRLDASDATFVDTIHTNDGGYGYEGPYGTCDFFVNGGKAPQPGCDGTQSYCSHNMAVAFFAKSIIDTSVRAFACDVCSEGAEEYSFGEYVSKQMQGSYYVTTTSEY